MEPVYVTKSTFELLIQLIEVLIWPASLVLIMWMFRRSFSGAINRMGSIKADGSGISLTFEKKIEEAKQIFNQLSTTVISKDGTSIRPSGKRKTPYEQVLAINSNLNEDIKDQAVEANVVIAGLSPQQITEKLSETGVLTIQQAKKINALQELLNAADDSISRNQADQVEMLYDKIEL